MSKYIAKQSIGHFRPGQEITGLEAKQLQALLASGAIEEFQEPEVPQGDNSAERIAELEEANAELTKTNADLGAEKVKSEQSAAALSAKNSELEKALSDAQAALKKATAEAKKAATPAEK